MAGRIDFRKVETPTEFQQICERLLARMFPEFHPVNQAGGDAGVDGFASWGDQFFQFTHTQANIPIRKVREDLEKVRQVQGLKKWYFLCSQALSIGTWRYIEAQKAVCPFEIVIWDGAVLKELLSQHPDMVDEFFPEYAKKAYVGTETIREDISRLKKVVTRARKKPPKPGDSSEGLEIDENEKQDIRDLIMQLSEEEAQRRHLPRKDSARFIRGEWGEFNRHFELSAYDRLAKARFEESINYLRQKLFAKRNNEPRYLTVGRERNGIHAIANSLGWTEEQRHAFYRKHTNKDSLTQMSRQEIHKVFQELRHIQDGTAVNP
ncbi:MAG: restriction endonuclease [Terriglobia bacterium]